MSSKGNRQTRQGASPSKRVSSPLDVCKDLRTGTGINQEDISTKVTVLTLTHPEGSARDLARESFKFKSAQDYTFDERYAQSTIKRPERPDQDKVCLVFHITITLGLLILLVI